MVGRVNDVELYRELMRRGASANIWWRRSSPLHLTEVISGLYLDPGAAPIGRVVAFVGARGGAGSSTIAHNVGWCVAEELEHQHHHRGSRSAVRHGRAWISTTRPARASPTRCRRRNASTMCCSTAC